MIFSKTAIRANASISVQIVMDRLVVMRKQECTTYRRRDVLSTPIKLSDCVVDGSWRQPIVEWMYNFVDQCNFSRDSVAAAASILDLSLEKGVITSQSEFRTCAMASLILCLKVNESVTIGLDDMVKLGRGLFNEQDIVDMEMKILQALNWHVHPPTPECFMRQYLQLLPASVSTLVRYSIAEVTKFITELSVCLTKFVKYPPSVIVCSAMLIAIDNIDDALLPLDLRQQMFESFIAVDGGMDYDPNEILEAVGELQQSVEENTCLQSLVNSIYSHGIAGDSSRAVKNQGLEGKAQYRSRVVTQ